MNYTWRRAAKAMLVTSSTTSFAFLASGFSKLMPIRSFGYFAALIIPMNFILVITLYPAILIVNEKIVKKINGKIFSLFKRKKADSHEDMKSNELEERPEISEQRKIHVNPKPSLLERFFGGPWNWLINKIKWFFFVFMLFWTALAIWRSILMNPLSE